MDAARLFQSADALEVTGLTRSQLREWTGRRNIISPDVRPSGPGRHALYTWQSLLVLRILFVLQHDFAVEVGAWAPAARELREQLHSVSFPNLWYALVFFPNRLTAQIIDDVSTVSHTGFLLPLAPHLTVITSKLSLSPPDQLSLLLPVAVS